MNAMTRRTARIAKRLAITATLAVTLGLGCPMKGQGYDPFKSAAPAKSAATGNVISSVEFVDTPITTIFKMISDLTGWSVMMSPEVTKQPPKINLWIKNLPAERVLGQVVELAGLVADRRDNTVTVMTYEEYCRQFGVDKTILPLRNARARDLAALLKPMVEREGQSRILPDERSNQVILLVPKPLLGSLEKLVAAMDVPLEATGDTIRLITLRYVEAASLTPLLEQFLTQASRGGGGGAPPAAPRAAEAGPTRAATSAPADEASATASPVGAGSNYSLRFLCEGRLNVIVLRGPAQEVETACRLVADLDVPGDLRSVSYSLAHADAREVFEALEATMGDRDKASRFRLALSQSNSKIVVYGSPADHQRVAEMIEAMDKPLPESGGIRVYRLENATATEVARVIQDLIGLGTSSSSSSRATGLRPPMAPPAGGVQRVTSSPRQTNRPAEPSSPSPAPSAGRGGETASDRQSPPSVIASPEINAVIVQASATRQEELARLIGELDRPRDQVVLEVMLVSVRNSDGFNLGLELAGASVNDKGVDQITFTHFGIGDTDTATGKTRLSADPLTGLNFAIFNSSDFSLVLNALQSVGDTRITSSPKILVEDNCPAQISQINQEPFEVTDQGETTTTTSFGGFVDAGTVLTVTPHLSREDWLRLAYEVTFSAFGARTNAKLPPPRLQNVINGTVRVPAEHTVVLGGLVNTRTEKTTEGVPFLMDIPLLGELFKNRSNDDSKETLFVFIRPVLLREASFEDLIALSRDDLRTAEVRPADQPMNPIQLFPWQYPTNDDKE